MPASASATTAHRQAASSTISRGCGARARRRMRHVSHGWSGLTASSGCPRIPATGWWLRGLRHRPARDSTTPLTHTRGHHEHTKEEDLPDACHPGRRRAGQRLAVGPRARPAARARSFREIGDEAADLPQETLAAFGGLPCPLRPRIPVPGEKRIRALLRDTCTATRASVPSRDHDPAGRPTVLARQFGGRTAGLYRRPVGRRRGPLRRDLALAGHADPARTTKETRNGTSLPPSNSGCSPQLIVFTRNAPPRPAPCPHRPRDPAPNPVPTTPDPASRSATPRRLNVADLFWPGTHVRTPDQDRVQRPAICIELPR